MNRIELEDRLIKFSVMMNDILESLPRNNIGDNLSRKLSRSGISPVLNYAEAQSAESRKDFIHKMKIVLKELREVLAGLKLIREAKLTETYGNLEKAIIENNELISIFVKSIETARSNDQKSKIKRFRS
jgi:four helix bundle protein